MKKILTIGIVLAIVIFAIYSFKQWFYPAPNPEKTFRYLVANPIPNSVASIQEGNSIAMDSVFRVLSFQINKTDLKMILDSQHFVPIDENQEFKQWDSNSKQDVKISKDDYLNSWKQQIQRRVKLDVNFSNSWQIFTLKEGNGTKYFFFDTNSTAAVFVADAH
jgi:hypothetical protein